MHRSTRNLYLIWTAWTLVAVLSFCFHFYFVCKQIYGKAFVVASGTFVLWLVGIFASLYGFMRIKKEEERLSQTARLVCFGNVVSGIAHEINNPLAIAVGNTSLLEEKIQAVAPSEEFARLLSKIKAAHSRISETITSLVSATENSEKITEVDLQAAIKRTMNILKPHYLPIQIQVLPNEANPMIIGNRDLVEKSLVQLLMNAREAVEYREGPKIVIATEILENQVAMTVSDNGCGIKKEFLDKIFDPFFTSKEPGRGKGLGLFVVHSLLKLMNAQITITSQEGRGTEAKVLFRAAGKSAS